MPFSCLSDFLAGREIQLIHHADTAVFKGGFHRDFAILLDGAERRAEAVKQWLEGRGIAAGRITAVGRGSDVNEKDAEKARRAEVTDKERKEDRR